MEDEDVPTCVIEHLVGAPASVCAFNRRGTFLAFGLRSGYVTVWDYSVLSVAQQWSAHENEPVKGLCWTQNSRSLLSYTKGGELAVWDVVSGSCTFSARLEGGNVVRECSVHPTDPSRVLVMFSMSFQGQQDSPMVVVRLSEGGELAPPRSSTVLEGGPQAGAFHRDGRRIIAFRQGEMLEYDAETLAVLERRAMRIKPPVVSVCLSESGTGPRIAVVTAKSVFVMHEGTVQLSEFSDLVNRTRWDWVSFSPNNVHVYAGTSNESGYDIYIYSLRGKLVKVLHGDDEPCVHMQHHPQHPAEVIAIGKVSGRGHLWRRKEPIPLQHAFPAGYVESVHNVDYIEQEDEFDLKPQAEMEREREEKRQAERDYIKGVDVRAAILSNTYAWRDPSESAPVESDGKAPLSDVEDELMFLPINTVPEGQDDPMVTGEVITLVETPFNEFTPLNPRRDEHRRIAKAARVAMKEQRERERAAIAAEAAAAAAAGGATVTTTTTTTAARTLTTSGGGDGDRRSNARNAPPSKKRRTRKR